MLSIGSDHNARQRDRIERELAGDRVGRPFVGIGNRDREQLREQHQRHGEKYAQLQISAVGRPDVRPQELDGSRQRSLPRRVPARGDER